MVEAVNGFGSGVVGLSVLTHTHTLPMILVVHPLTQALLPLHELLNTHALQIRVLLVAVHLHALPIWLLIVFTHRNFPGFPHVVFPSWI